MKTELTWLHSLNLLWHLAAKARPAGGWGTGYGARWLRSLPPETERAATAVVQSYTRTWQWPAELPEAVRAVLFLRALTAMGWALTFREKHTAPQAENLHDFVSWSMDTMWYEEGRAWMLQRLPEEGPLPDLPVCPERN